MVMFVSLPYPRLMPILRRRTLFLDLRSDDNFFLFHSQLPSHVPLNQDIDQERFCKKKGKQDNSSTKRQATTRAMATDLFAITVDADDYATTAADDVHDQVTTRTDGGEGEVEEEKEKDENEKDDDEKEEEETQSRTFQSEENFQLQRKNYSAKIYGHHHHHHHHPSKRCGLYEEFQLQVFHGLDAGLDVDVEKYGDGKEGDVEEKEKIQLSKSQIQFLGQVIGEMYFEEEFEELVEFCGRVRRRCCCFCGGQKGLEERLRRWEGRCLERLGRGRGEW